MSHGISTPSIKAALNVEAAEIAGLVEQGWPQLEAAFAVCCVPTYGTPEHLMRAWARAEVRRIVAERMAPVLTWLGRA